MQKFLISFINMSFWNANIQKMKFKPKESDVFMAKF